MPRPLIIWNLFKLETLEDAITAGGETVTWEERERPGRFGKIVATHNWPMDEAERVAQSVRIDMKLNPMPVLGENKEGKEP